MALVLELPSQGELAVMAKGTPYALAVRLIPVDFLETVAPLLRFTCVPCFGRNENGTEKDSGQTDIFAEVGKDLGGRCGIDVTGNG